MTSAATPKGARRQARLIAAAGELLLEGGFDAVRHRAVADRANLPLASTTYYFASLEDLIVEAVTYACRIDEDAIRGRCETLTRRRRGNEATAEALADVFVGAGTSRDELTSRVETVVLSARYPRLHTVLHEHRKVLRELHYEVLEKSCRTADSDKVTQLIAVEDGAVVGALADSTENVAAAARWALVEVVDQLAPASSN